MSSILDKRTAIVDLFKVVKFRQDISKSLKVNEMLVWRTLKRQDETEDIQNRQGQGRPRTVRTPRLVKSTREKIRRNPKRSMPNLTNQTMSTVLRKDLKMTSFKHVTEHELSAQVVSKMQVPNTTLNMQDPFFPHSRWHAAKHFFSVMRRIQF